MCKKIIKSVFLAFSLFPHPCLLIVLCRFGEENRHRSKVGYRDMAVIRGKKKVNYIVQIPHPWLKLFVVQ